MIKAFRHHNGDRTLSQSIDMLHTVAALLSLLLANSHVSTAAVSGFQREVSETWMGTLDIELSTTPKPMIMERTQQVKTWMAVEGNPTGLASRGYKLWAPTGDGLSFLKLQSDPVSGRIREQLVDCVDAKAQQQEALTRISFQCRPRPEANEENAAKATSLAQVSAAAGKQSEAAGLSYPLYPTVWTVGTPPVSWWPSASWDYGYWALTNKGLWGCPTGQLSTTGYCEAASVVYPYSYYYAYV